MADKQQLALIKQGPKVWNTWRQNNRAKKINLKGADLSKQKLSGADFSGNKTDLRGVNFREADLESADFSCADIRGTNFRDAKLKHANFCNVKAGLQSRFGYISKLSVINYSLSAISGLFAGAIGYTSAFVFYQDDAWAEFQLGATIFIPLVSLLAFVLHRDHKNTVLIVGFGVLAYIVITIAVGVYLISAIAGILVIFVFASAVSGVFIDQRGSKSKRKVTVKFISTMIATSVAIIVAAAPIPVERYLAQGEVPSGMQERAQKDLELGIVPQDAVDWVKQLAQGEVPSGMQERAQIVLKAAPVTVPAAGIAAASCILLSDCLIRRNIFKGNENPWINSLAIAFATAVEGTIFYGSDLTQVNFRGATIELTDFRKATLDYVCLQEVKKLNNIRPGNTILKDEEIRKLLRKSPTQSSFD